MKELSLIERALIHDALRHFVGGSGIHNWDTLKAMGNGRGFQDMCTNLAEKILPEQYTTKSVT
jgi:hypothetical protein